MRRAWLVWLIDGRLARLPVILGPAAWRPYRSRRAVFYYDNQMQYETMLGASSCPLWVVKLLTCPACMSAHLSLVATVVRAAILSNFASEPYTYLLIWAAASFIGLFFFDLRKLILKHANH